MASHPFCFSLKAIMLLCIQFILYIILPCSNQAFLKIGSLETVIWYEIIYRFQVITIDKNIDKSKYFSPSEITSGLHKVGVYPG